MSVVSWRRMASDLTDQVRELQKERDELLAEVERLTKARKRHAKLEREAVLAYGKMSKRAEAAEAKVLQLGIEKAEAARAAERERRCDECESREGSSHYCLLWTINTPDEHYCRDWTARDSGGGAS